MAKPPKKSYQLLPLVMAAFVVLGALVLVKLKIPLLPTSSTMTNVIADTSLSFVPTILTGKVGETKTVSITISSGKNTVTGAEFQLSLDSSVARIRKASAGAFFDKPTVLANVLSKSGGSLHFAVGSLTPNEGDGALVNITVRLIKPGSTTMAFSDVKIAAVGAGSTNVLRAASPITIIVAKP